MSFPWSSRISATRIIPGEATPSPHFHHPNDENLRQGGILDEVCAVTGWSREGARRRLVAAAKRPPGRRKSAERRARARRYSYDALKVLQRVWAASGGQCGKYLKESMPVLLDLLEASGELDDEPRYTPAVRDELVAMSAATIDRYLAPVRATEQLRGKSTTKTGPLAFAAPSRSARPVTRSRLNLGSSRSTPSPTAGRPSKESSPGL